MLSEGGKIEPYIFRFEEQAKPMTEIRVGNLGRWVLTGKRHDGTFWVMEMFLS